MRLLIVDDSSFIRLQIKNHLEDLPNIEIAEAINGIEALEKHRTFKPDIITLDYIIPAPDGLAILKILTKIDKKVKIIMATSLSNQKYIYKTCIECGAFAIIEKPITKDNLLMKNNDPRKALFDTIGQKNIQFDPCMIEIFGSTIDWPRIYNIPRKLS